MIELFKRYAVADRIKLGTFLAFMIACLFFGGASRGDVLSQPVVQLAALFLIVVTLFIEIPKDIGRIKVSLLSLLALAGLMVAQMIPLPPSLWAALPGHNPYWEVARLSETTEAWRPMSLTPDQTLDSLLGLLPPIAALIGLAGLPPSATRPVLALLVAIGLVNCTLGILQLASGGAGPLYPYRITNEGYPVGFFANRNHQALLSAMTIPMLAVWASLPRKDTRAAGFRIWLAVAGVIYLTPMILVAGSRAGFVLAIISTGVSWLLIRGSRGRLNFEGRWTKRGFLILPPFIIGGLAAITYYLSRAETIRRIFAVDNAADERYRYLQPTLKMLRDFFPFGSGFGSFEAVFRQYEPEKGLTPFYFNHAHNDYLEVPIEGGLVAILIFAGLGIWIIGRIVAAWRRSTADETDTIYARLASVMVLMMAAASVVDYPLRTPMIAVMFAICAFWLSGARREISPIRSTSVVD